MTRGSPRPAHLRVRDHVHVDVAGSPDRAIADAGSGEQGREPVPAAHAEHELGGVLGPGEGQQRLRHVVADDLVVGPAKGLDQAALLGERGRIGAGQAVRLGDVDREEVAAGRAGGDPGRSPDQRVALGPPGERDHHPFPRFPGPVDVVRRPVPLQPLVDLVGQPEQGEFAQRGQVPGAEVVRQRRVDLLRRVDVAVGHPAAQCLRRHVDELDLVGRADDRVGDGLPLRHAGDLLDHVVQRRQMLDVDVRDDVDAGLEQFLHVLPALLVARSGDVRVRELVHERHLGPARQHGVDVHLVERRAAVGQAPAGHHLQALDLRGGVRPAVRLHEGHDDVGAPLGAPVALAEHGEGLAHPGSRAEVDPQLAAAAANRLGQAARVIRFVHRSRSCLRTCHLS